MPHAEHNYNIFIVITIHITIIIVSLYFHISNIHIVTIISIHIFTAIAIHIFHVPSTILR